MTEVKQLIQQIHDAPPQSVVAVAGAGSQAVAWLLGVSGASRTLLEVLVPYGRLSMVEFLGHEPEQFVSSSTAKDMARAAYLKGMQLREDDSPIVGLACTATIATDRLKRGDHRCHIATWDDKRATVYDLTLDKGKRDRDGEEEVVSRLLLHALAESYGIEPDLLLGLTEWEHPEIIAVAHSNPIQRLLSGEIKTVQVDVRGGMTPDDTEGIKVILPGSFNPVHHGHLDLAAVASEMLGDEVVFELSVVNVDKPPLEEDEIRRRVEQFNGVGRVVLTRAETFRKKSELLPGASFVIGWDTAVRLVDPRYYGGQEESMLKALAEMWAMGSKFLVAGRQHDGGFKTLDDVQVHPGFQYLFHAVPESRFRSDISSTELRT